MVSDFQPLITSHNSKPMPYTINLYINSCCCIWNCASVRVFTRFGGPDCLGFSVKVCLLHAAPPLNHHLHTASPNMEPHSLYPSVSEPKRNTYRARVLHMDGNDYYRGESTSLNLNQGSDSPPAELGQSRDYNVDMVPKVGWWAGFSDDNQDPCGRIIQISAEHGRCLAINYTPSCRRSNAVIWSWMKFQCGLG